MNKIVLVDCILVKQNRIFSNHDRIRFITAPFGRLYYKDLNILPLDLESSIRIVWYNFYQNSVSCIFKQMYWLNLLEFF